MDENIQLEPATVVLPLQFGRMLKSPKRYSSRPFFTDLGELTSYKEAMALTK